MQIFLGSLLVAAIYGCVSLVFLLNRKRAGGIPIVFVSFAVVIGALSWILGIFSNAVGHIDCADSCAAYIPDRAATQRLDSLLLPFAMLVPLAFLIVVIVGRVLERRGVRTRA